MPNPKTYEYTAKLVSEAAKLPIRNVYFHFDSGRLDLNDLRSVALFISYYYYGALKEEYYSGAHPHLSSPLPTEGGASLDLTNEPNDE